MKLTKGPFKGYTVEFAPQDKVEIYANEVYEVLEAIGFSEAWVSDESSIADFGFKEPWEVEELAKTLGVEINGRWDRIWEVAERIYCGRHKDNQAN